MSYLGGKARKAEYILDVLNASAFDGMRYVEPFVGYAHILRRVEKKASYEASDSNELLMHLLQHIQQGSEIPRIRDKDEYTALRYQTGTNLRRAVAAFAYSFNGKEFGGFTMTYTRRTGKVNDVAESRLRYYRDLSCNEQFRKTVLSCRDYKEAPNAGALVYCDPPYDGTCSYKTATFDTNELWDVVRVQPKKVRLHGHSKKEVYEKLYAHESLRDFLQEKGIIRACAPTV